MAKGTISVVPKAAVTKTCNLHINLVTQETSSTTISGVAKAAKETCTVSRAVTANESVGMMTAAMDRATLNNEAGRTVSKVNSTTISTAISTMINTTVARQAVATTGHSRTIPRSTVEAVAIHSTAKAIRGAFSLLIRKRALILFYLIRIFYFSPQV
jgi:hypothetical protein